MTADRPAAILDELAEIRVALDRLHAVEQDHYDRRLTLLREARRMDPPMRHKDLAAASGMASEVGVIAALRKADAKAAAG